MKSHSISDDDLCSSCVRCVYEPGEKSQCMREFPAQTDCDGYISACADYMEQDYAGQNVPPLVWLKNFDGGTAANSEGSQ